MLTGVPAQVTAKRGPLQLGGPQPVQSLPVGVQATALGCVLVWKVGQVRVHAVHVPLAQVSSPLQLPQTSPHPSEPQFLPLQLGVQTAVQLEVETKQLEQVRLPV